MKTLSKRVFSHGREAEKKKPLLGVDVSAESQSKQEKKTLHGKKSVRIYDEDYVKILLSEHYFLVIHKKITLSAESVY